MVWCVIALEQVLVWDSFTLKHGQFQSVPVVLYGCETWSLILREERRLRVFENRVLRRAFRRKSDKVTEK
jgi:hypothetical protein